MTDLRSRPEWAQRLRAARLTHGLTPIKAAEALRGLDPTQPMDLETIADYFVKRWETGKHLPGAHNRQQLCLLYGDPALFAGMSTGALVAPSNLLPTGHTVEVVAELQEEGDTDVMNRRAVLHALTGLAIGVPASRVATEAARHGLLMALDGRGDASADEWQGIALQYTRDFYTTAPVDLLQELTADLVLLQQLIGVEHNARTGAGLYQAASQLCVVMAMSLAELGRTREAQRWWRTGRAAADQSGSLELRVWTRDWEAVNGLYERRPIPELLRLSDEALAIGADIPCSGTAGTLAARAQALSMIGDDAAARETLNDLEDLTSRLPPAVVRDESSMFGWPEYRVRYTQSYVYTHLRDTPNAYAAQDSALSLYPPELAKERARLQLHRARCFVTDGDIRGGLSYALDVLDDLAVMYQNEVLYEVGRELLDALPRTERTRPAAQEFRSRLVSEVPGAVNELST